MQQEFSGQVALVAGSARPPGIGHATAMRLARGGASVACVEAVGGIPDAWPADAYDTGIVPAATHQAATREVAAAGPGDTQPFTVDPFDPASWEGAAAAVLDHYGRIDICCALMGTTGPYAGDGYLTDVPLESVRRCFDVNYLAPLVLARACARDMIRRESGGVIVMLSSYSAVVPPPGSGVVAAARAATNMTIQSLAAELGKHGIRVNGVQPLSVHTDDPRFPNPGLARMATGQAGSVTSWVRSALPLGRPQAPDETAAVVEFLCSAAASFVSGVSIPVAGGSHSHA